MNISAVIVSYNEVDRIPALMKSLEGIDDIVFGDDGSQDGTVALAESLGARVFRRADHSSTVTDADVEEFFTTFQYFPAFKAGDKIFHGSDNRNEAVAQAKNDWIFNPDCDEIVTWDLKEIKKLLPACDMVLCKISDEQRSYDCRKLFDRTKCRFEGRIHELPMGIQKGTRAVRTDKMSIRHYQKPKEHRANYLPVLEYAALKDSDLRSCYYLAREYFRHNEFAKAERTYRIYLKSAWWEPEIAEAFLFLSKCCWRQGKMAEANDACMKALLVNPDFKEALVTMAAIRPEKRDIWLRYAKQAQNTGVLIARM